MNAAMLLLADGRFPSGGHAHSGGLEAAVSAGRVTGVDELESFLRGRLATSGPVVASFAAAAHLAVGAGSGDLGPLDGELDARTAAPALRLASRRQGRALLRAGRAIWPSPVFDRIPRHPDGPHHAVVLGVTAAAASLSVEEAALIGVYHVITGPASAAVRLLGLDPYQVTGLLARLAGACDAVARTAAASAGK
ncbi:MAG: urease accessory protein UreF, partial [Actinobacteria bacterium 13_2_20CM_2_71_6]